MKQERAKPATRPPNPATQKPALPVVTRRTIHNLPFRPNPLFTGREAELEALSRALQQTDATGVMQMVAVHGLGGVGKTQLAVEYAWKHIDDYEAVFWVKADSVAALDVGLAALALPPALGLPEALEREQAVQTMAAFDWLSNHQRWLLIADNADRRLACQFEFLGSRSARQRSPESKFYWIRSDVPRATGETAILQCSPSYRVGNVQLRSSL